MKVLYDINVVLDILQERHPYYESSSVAVDLVIKGEVDGFFPDHGATTIHYIIRRMSNRDTADECVDWLLRRFSVVECNHRLLEDSRGSAMSEFEDAVVAQSVLHLGCDYVVTGNLKHFRDSPVAAISPAGIVRLVRSSG